VSWWIECECGGRVSYDRMPTGTYDARCAGCGTQWRGIDVFRKSGDSISDAAAAVPWKPATFSRGRGVESPLLNKSGGSDVEGR
jgi:hypothetical protein